MNVQERNEKVDIFDGEKKAGSVSVRYPELGEEYKRIDQFYLKIASSYIRYAEKHIPKIRKNKKFPGIVNCILFCRVTYSDETKICISAEVREYLGNELMYRRRFSNVWDIQRCNIEYLRKYGIRKNCISYNGKELRIFSQ